MHISSVSCLHVQHWCFVDTFKFFTNFYRSTCNTHGLPDSLTCNAILGYLCTAQSKIGLAPSQLPLRRIHPSVPSTTQGVRDKKQAALALKLGDIYRVSHSHESFESYYFHCTQTNERKENREQRNKMIALKIVLSCRTMSHGRPVQARHKALPVVRPDGISHDRSLVFMHSHRRTVQYQPRRTNLKSKYHSHCAPCSLWSTTALHPNPHLRASNQPTNQPTTAHTHSSQYLS